MLMSPNKGKQLSMAATARVIWLSHGYSAIPGSCYVRFSTVRFSLSKIRESLEPLNYIIFTNDLQ